MVKGSTHRGVLSEGRAISESSHADVSGGFDAPDGESQPCATHTVKRYASDDSIERDGIFSLSLAVGRCLHELMLLGTHRTDNVYIRFMPADKTFALEFETPSADLLSKVSRRGYRLDSHVLVMTLVDMNGTVVKRDLTGTFNGTRLLGYPPTIDKQGYDRLWNALAFVAQGKTEISFYSQATDSPLSFFGADAWTASGKMYMFGIKKPLGGGTSCQDLRDGTCAQDRHRRH